MANIMINKICNAKCPYCFANKFVNATSAVDESNITIDDFKKALDFIFNDGNNERIGIIGGEPTLHPKFQELMEIVFRDPRVREITLFTNGINLDKYSNLMANPKITTLINVNSPTDIGIKNFEKVMQNIDYLVNKLYIRDKISLGINMYKEDFEYDYMVNALEKFGFDRVRVSIVVPNTDDKRNSNPLEYFTRMKPRVLEFFKVLKSKKIYAHYDCNSMPPCILNKEEMDFMTEYYLEDKNSRDNRLVAPPFCTPVIDILPDLNAIRCFGCSNEKIQISKFQNIFDLRKYFELNIDNYSKFISTVEQCIDCYQRNTQKCTSGCLAFKYNKMLQMNNLIQSNILQEVTKC